MVTETENLQHQSTNLLFRIKTGITNSVFAKLHNSSYCVSGVEVYALFTVAIVRRDPGGV